MAHGIVLSKDRAAQAHLALESLQKNGNGLFDNLSVLYHYSTLSMRQGYEELMKHFPTVTFINQMNYYEDIKSLVNVDYYLTSFFTDDDIMYNQIPVSREDIVKLFEDTEDVLGCFSLRLGLNTSIQDPYLQSQTVPPTSGFHFIEDGKYTVWKWCDCPPYMNFGYPMSVDGHIFRTSELDRVISQCKFVNPNQQEIAMSGKSDMIKSLMASFPASMVINTPINRVQSTCMNRAGEVCGQDPEEMNNKYLSGYKLSLDSVTTDNPPIVGCHQELNIQWIMK